MLQYSVVLMSVDQACARKGLGKKGDLDKGLSMYKA